MFLVLLLSFFGFVGIVAGRIVLTLYALELGAQPFLVGLLTACFYAFPLLTSWPIGSLSDRLGSRWLLFAGSVFGVGAMLVPFAGGNMASIFAGAAMIGLSFSFTNVLLQNLVGQLSSPGTRARDFANFSLVGASTNLVGPMVAGLSIDHIGMRGACLVAAGVSLVLTILLVVRGSRLPGGQSHRRSGGSALATLSDRNVLRVLAASSAVQLGVDLYMLYMPILGHALGLSATAIGAVLSGFAAASFVARLAMARLLRRLREETLLTWSFWVGACGLVLMPFFHHPMLLGLASFVFGLGMGLGQPLTLMLTLSHAPQGRSGETLGLRLTLNSLMRVLGPLAFGAIGSGLGLAAVFWINALMMSGGGWISRPRDRASSDTRR